MARKTVLDEFQLARDPHACWLDQTRRVDELTEQSETLWPYARWLKTPPERAARLRTKQVDPETAAALRRLWA